MGLKLVVVCPADAVTGGPEAMHQLVHVANQVERGSAAILYWPFLPQTTPQPYQHYVCPKILRDQVPSGAVVVFPEIWPEIAHTFKNRCALWWLSVDNFGTHGQRNIERISLHLCQSEYAWRHVEGLGKRLMLTDWVSIENGNTQRLPRVAVNPVKDAGLLRAFQQAAPCEVIELRGLSRYGLTSALRGSKVYIDFGRHPGRDRLPREAALAGCTVFSTRHGAAGFFEDMPLDDWFKFDTLDKVLERVASVLNGDDVPSQDFYQSWVAGNRDVFEAEVKALLDVC